MKKRLVSLLLIVVMLLPLFNITVIAASDPVITSHENGKSYEADDFYVKWKSVSGAKRYRLAVKSMNDGSYAADIYWDDNLTKTKYKCDEDDIKPGHRYKIWVGACGTGHNDVISQYSVEVMAKAAVCDHDDCDDYYDYTKYEQISSDNNYHNAIHYYERVCDDCGETIKSNVKGNIEKEKHNFSGDKCKDCGYKKTCSHDDCEDYYDYTKYEQINGDNNYHNTVNYYKKECDDCGKIIKEDIKGEIKKESHVFSGDICSVCKYKKVHTHTTQDYYKTTKYEQINGDDTYHRAVHYYDTKCTDCGSTIETNVKGGTEKEKHSFSGETCTVCKYKKTHKHTTKDIYKITKYEQISGDNTYHNAVKYYERKCDDCGKTIKSDIRGEIRKEAHIFSGDKCTKCDYTKKSEADTTRPQINPIKSSAGSSFVEGTKTTFSTRASDNALYMVYMYIDGKEVKKTSSDTIEYSTSSLSVGRHTIEVVAEDESGNENDASIEVIVTKKVNSCSHEGFYHSYNYKHEQIKGNDEYHIEIRSNIWECAECGYIKPDDQIVRSNQKHSFSGDTCVDCKYKKIHEHTTKDIYKTIKHEQISGDDTYHRAVHYYDTKCTDCGSTIETNVKGGTEKEKHSFSGETCTVCKYIKKKPNVSVNEEQDDNLFIDVKGNEYYANDVYELVENGIITGYGDGMFNPLGTLTRAEAAVIMCRLNGNFNLKETKTKFSDVNITHKWASGYIAKAVQLNIISGMPGGTYKPGDTLSAEQFIAMLVRWLGLENNAINRGGNTWSAGYIAVAYEIGLLDNVKLTNFSAGISRAEACVIANAGRWLKGKVTAEEIKKEPSDEGSYIPKGTLFTSDKLTVNRDEVIVNNGDYSVDVDGISAALYAPKYITRGISTHVNMANIRTNVVNHINSRSNDRDNVYAYVCCNSFISGDFGFLKSGSSSWSIVSSLPAEPKYSPCYGWQLAGLSGLDSLSNYETIDYNYIDYSSGRNLLLKSGVVERMQDVQFDLHMEKLTANEISIYNKDLDILRSKELIYIEGPNGEKIIRNIDNYRSGDYKLVFKVRFDGKEIYTLKLPFSTHENGNSFNLSTDSINRFGCVASVTNSHDHFSDTVYGCDNVENTSYRRGKKGTEYLSKISNSSMNGNREAVKYENVEFTETYYYPETGYPQRLTTENGFLWLYPCKNHNTKGVTNQKTSGVPIVQYEEQFDNLGAVKHIININNY